MRLTAIELTEAQKEALVDLLVLGMYADATLTSAEDDYLQRLLDTFEFSSEYTRQSFADAAFTRTRGYCASPALTCDYVEKLARSFQSVEARRDVYEALEELLSSDGGATDEEGRMLSLVREAFGL
jgi:hypothetical protein